MPPRPNILTIGFSVSSYPLSKSPSKAQNLPNCHRPHIISPASLIHYCPKQPVAWWSMTTVATRIATWLRSFGGFLSGVVADVRSTLRSWSPPRWCAAVALLIAVVAFLVFVDVPDLEALRTWAEHLGPWFILVFGAAYILFTQFPIPRTLWTVAAGVLFGAWEGIVISLVALTLSAVLSLVIVRALFGEWIRPHLTHPAVFKINAHLERRGWLAIASLRMVAGIPFSILNYVAALTPIPLIQFAAATFIGSIPTTVVGVIFGDALIAGGNPWTILAFIVFGVIGVAGLFLDSRIPTRPPVKRSR